MTIDETDGRKIKKSRKYLVERDHEEDVKEEIDKESNEEEEKSEAEKEQQDLQVPPETPSK